eukprot:CAMPEP_0171914880 /NCGR_PEP_ID=MMETSP0993-20121228/13269_1 /TAXON_ID=483369 /ORGANISM="non described non described, Strain CCMP2098" /LENGTH=78 /DNA_ID=CAMNT_0012549605 /DNA_START=243 /DNA_END=477 /DNA_ORIENTATION=-
MRPAVFRVDHGLPGVRSGTGAQSPSGRSKRTRSTDRSSNTRGAEHGAGAGACGAKKRVEMHQKKKKKKKKKNLKGRHV